MKKLKYRLVAVIIALSMTCGISAGCSTTEEKEIHNEERVKYNLAEASLINLYKGDLYAVGLSQDTTTENNTRVEIFAKDGEKKGELLIKNTNGSISCWDISEDRVYFVSEVMEISEESKQWGNKCELYSVGIEGVEPEKLYTFEDFSSMKKIRVSQDGIIYCLGLKKSYEDYSDTLYLDNGETVDYSYSGEVFGSFDKTTGDFLAAKTSFPVAFDERNGDVILYAFDKENGFYFHDIKSGTDLYTNKLKQIDDMEMINDNKDYVFAGGSGYTGTLAVSGISDESGVIQIDDNMIFSRCGQICAEDDYICVNALEDVYSYDRNVFKYYTANVSTDNPPVNIISSSFYEPLFSCGSQIKNQQLSVDGFALTVLSLDESYDLAMLSTREIYANDIKEKGSFYPLNNVPGVAEFLDSCFPYVSEAAVNDKGEIWMLPISLDVCSIIYNEKNCADNDVTFPNGLEDFLRQIRKGAEASKYYDCSGYCVTEMMINSYLSLNHSFNTDSFRSFTPLLKDMNNDKVFIANPNINVSLALSSKQINDKLGTSDVYTDTVYNGSLFTTILSSSSQRNLIGDENLLAASLPYAEGAKSGAICTFVCVNPNSEHLEETLLFIERTVARLSQQQNSFVLKDKNTYGSDSLAQSLYGIYANAEIYFDVPSDVYYNDLEKYFADEITLEQFIAEADRKLSAYLNE